MKRESSKREKKLSFSGLTAKQAFQLVPTENTIPWQLTVAPRPPSPTLLTNFERMETAFALLNSEAAKLSIIDVVLLEVLPHYPRLRAWKAASLENTTIAGVADYLIAPKRAYVETPLLCAVEAGYPLGADDFEAGEVQCVAGYPQVLRVMAVCLHNNRRDGHNVDVYGIVSNGQGWVFYRLTPQAEVYVSEQYALRDLPTLLGAVDFVCAECAKNVPSSPATISQPSG